MWRFVIALAACGSGDAAVATHVAARDPHVAMNVARARDIARSVEFTLDDRDSDDAVDESDKCPDVPTAADIDDGCPEAAPAIDEGNDQPDDVDRCPNTPPDSDDIDSCPD